MQLIGIHGPRGSGKTTIAKALADLSGEANTPAQVMSFATPIKDMLRILLLAGGMQSDTIERCIAGDMKERPLPLLQGKSSRFAMQTLGTEWGRNTLGTDLWVDLALNRLRQEKAHVVIFDDVRYMSEYRAIISRRGWVVDLQRPDTRFTREHTSENGLDDVKDSMIRVFNTGDPRLVAHEIMSKM